MKNRIIELFLAGLLLACAAGCFEEGESRYRTLDCDEVFEGLDVECEIRIPKHCDWDTSSYRDRLEIDCDCPQMED